MADIEQQARQMLTTEYAQLGYSKRLAESPGACLMSLAAVRAIVAALRSAPEGFALVDLDENSVLPDTPTERMLDAGWPDYEMIGLRFDKEGAYADLLAAASAPSTLATVKPPRNRRTRLREDV